MGGWWEGGVVTDRAPCCDVVAALASSTQECLSLFIFVSLPLSLSPSSSLSLSLSPSSSLSLSLSPSLPLSLFIFVFIPLSLFRFLSLFNRLVWENKVHQERASRPCLFGSGHVTVGSYAWLPQILSSYVVSNTTHSRSRQIRQEN